MSPANPAIPAGKAAGSMAAAIRSGRESSGNVNNANARNKAAAVADPASDRILPAADQKHTAGGDSRRNILNARERERRCQGKVEGNKLRGVRHSGVGEAMERRLSLSVYLPARRF